MTSGKQFLKSGIGGSIVIFLFGTALLSLFYNFWIGPYLFNGYTITTFAQFLTGILAFQIQAIVFLLIVVGWWLGYLGISFSRRGKR